MIPVELSPEEFVFLNDLLDKSPLPGRIAKGQAYNVQTKLEAAAAGSQAVVQSEGEQPPSEEPNA